ncbi:MAG: hypothetical protein Q4D62_06260 [Planctomycetia bacterium]|nr:hypothetical protein [Planctomycetia bacterium]
MVHSWLLTKKRGNRRTDSRFWGWMAEVGFATFCILAGFLGILWIFALYILPEWRVREHYQPVICTLEDVRVVKKALFAQQIITPEAEPATFFNEEETAPTEENLSEKAPGEEKNPAFPARSGIAQTQFVPELLFGYEVNGNTYRSWTKGFHSISQPGFATKKEALDCLREWKKGERYRCWYDPENPDHLAVGQYWSWENIFALLIPFSLLLIGTGALFHSLLSPHWGSREYSAAVAQRVTHFTPFEEGEKQEPYPTVPDGASITDSPGVRLAYRLPRADSPAWNLFWLGGMAILWNLVVLIHLGLFVGSWSDGSADWVRLFFTLPFALAGIGLLLWTVRQFRRATTIGPTLVELDRFPLSPGETVRFLVSQGGHWKVYWLNVMLVCEEEVVFTHGTNTRREQQRVFQRQLFCEEGFEITRAEPFEVEFSTTIPADAMHSFVSPHNQIKWQIIVQGAAANCPVFERSFPLIVTPGAGFNG